MNKDFVAAAKILGAHGLKGNVKLRCDLMNADDIENYDLYDKNGNLVEVTIVGSVSKNNGLLVKLNNIETKEEIEKFIGLDLFVKREDLPELVEDGEYYYHDIIGLIVMSNGSVFGKVKDMYNYGAGEILEIEKNDHKVELFTFNDSNFPIVDIKNGTIEINYNKA